MSSIHTVDARVSRIVCRLSNARRGFLVSLGTRKRRAMCDMENMLYVLGVDGKLRLKLML